MEPIAEIKRQPLKYYGSKWTIAPWIVRHFPYGFKNYVEPLFGGGSVFFQMNRAPLETINDADGAVVNYWRVVRDDPERLADALLNTPWARDEFELAAIDPRPAPLFEIADVERARRFALRAYMSLSNRAIADPGVRMLKHVDGRFERPSDDLIRLARGLGAVADRLRGVQIENRDWRDVVDEYANDDSLTYVDPPYPLETRDGRVGYGHEWTDNDHGRAAAILNSTPGFVVVSSYLSEMYVEMYERRLGWSRFDSEPVKTNSGGERVESIWLSPKTADALANDFGPLFAGVT